MKKASGKYFKLGGILVVILTMLVLGAVTIAKRPFEFEEDHVNVTELSQEFLEQYYEEYSEMAHDANKENILIVTAKSRPNDYGAVKVIEAPNHQYFLQYETKEEKDAALSKIAADGIEVQENMVQYTVGDYNSWGIEATHLDKLKTAAGALSDKKEVILAVIDTGLDMDVFWKNYPSLRVATYNAVTNSVTDMSDTDGHGTHVTGIIAEAILPSVKLLAIKASTTNAFYSTDVLTAVNYAIAAGADVINMSFGGYGYDRAEVRLLEGAEANGVVAVAAAGNQGRNVVMYPAGFNCTMAVSAVDSDYEIWESSNYGPEIDFAAPGVAVKSLSADPAKAYRNGTSEAAPHVAAAVALIKSANKDVGLSDVRNIMKTYAIDKGPEGRDEKYGYGVIDFDKAEFCGGTRCDDYGVFKSMRPEYGKIEIAEVKLTEYNYYSISNLLFTKVRVYTDETHYETKYLQEIDDLKITGYNPENKAEQTVTVSYDEISASFKVMNPVDYRDGWAYVVEDGKVVLEKYVDDSMTREGGAPRKIYLPETIGGKSVIAITGLEMPNREKLEHVYVPESLEMIGDAVFAGYSGLKKVTVAAAGGIELGVNAFLGDAELEAVEGVIKGLSEGAFSGVAGLTSVKFANTVEEIPDGAFDGCHSLAEINWPSHLLRIGKNAFRDNYRLREVSLANGLAEIGERAFENTRSLTNVVLPEGLAELGDWAFKNSGITGVYIPSTLKGERLISTVFDGCGNLETFAVAEGNPVYYTAGNRGLMARDSAGEVVLVRGSVYGAIMSNATVIGENAFSGITWMAGFTIPNGVKQIGAKAFYNCAELREITIPRTVKEIGEGVFRKEGVSPETEENIAVLLKVYSETAGSAYAVENELAYESLDASYGKATKTYVAMEKVNGNDQIELYYNYGVITDGKFVNYANENGRKVVHTVNEMSGTVNYMNEVGYLRVRDRYFMVSYKDANGDLTSVKVMVEMEGATKEPEMENRTGGVAEYEFDDGEIVVTAERACVVLVTKDDGVTYEVLKAEATDDENKYRFDFGDDADAKVVVALKGDTNMDGYVNVNDILRIARAIRVDATTKLDNLGQKIADTNNDGYVNVNDILRIARAIRVDALPMAW